LTTGCPAKGSMENDCSILEFGCDENKSDRKRKKEKEWFRLLR